VAFLGSYRKLSHQKLSYIVGIAARCAKADRPGMVCIALNRHRYGWRRASNFVLKTNAKYIA
jgi:hypothetical protein